MATSYDAAFQQSAVGSNRRAWLAESFLNLAMRHYWDLDQKRLYPAGPLPGAHELTAAFRDRTGVDCAAEPGDFFCLGPKVLAANEVGHGGGKPSPEAFRTSDAVYSGSGLTVGLQQIDIAAASKPEKALMRRWMPLTLGQRASYRAPIRLWTIDELNCWYGGDAAVANGEIASASARSAILASYVDHFIQAKAEWDNRISQAYPGWKTEWRTTLAIAATDIANVTGYRMQLPALATDVCQVLEYGEPRAKGGRTNALMLVKSDTAPRLRRMKHIVQPVAGFEDVDWRCISG